MNEEIRLATKSQAAAVRAYLATLGLTVSHVQALEVIARGQGMRSRHLLAQAPVAAPQAVSDTAIAQCAPKYTRVAYSYTDGSNCKRYSSIIFRGQLTRAQLRLVAAELDEGEYFVPAQVGLESLHLAFTGQPGDNDHWWHKLDLGAEGDWVVDGDDNIVAAGGVTLASEPNAGRFATDADCSNLTWRFTRLTHWDPDIQYRALTAYVHCSPEEDEVAGEELDADGRAYEAGQALADVWAAKPTLEGTPLKFLQKLAHALLKEGFIPVPGDECELRLILKPHVHQFCTLGRPHGAQADVEVTFFAASTLRGLHVLRAPVHPLSVETAAQGLDSLTRKLEAQREDICVYESKFD